MPIYVQYDGIPGDATSAGHEKWIEVNSFQWGIGRGIGDPAGGTADREGSTPTVSEIHLTKDTDSASPNLMRGSLGLAPAGEGKTVVIDFVKTDQGQPEAYLTLTLTNTLISGWSVSSGGDRPTESLTLNFTKVEFKNTGMGAANDTGSPDTAQYDLGAHTGS